MSVVVVDLIEKLAQMADARDDAVSQLKYWFDLSAKTEEQAVPVVLDGIRGYLRTAKNGGMPAEHADIAMSVLEDYCRLSLGRDLVPVLRGIAADISRQALP